mmetsp:Transcript_43093/g.91669  ORF Transcript_43093/g.91669 Transcript_43093/m.91669 type:complete len:243 (-) Transcript_43093:918-1646(-)
MPRRWCPLDPKGVSLSRGERFSVLMRLQSLEKTSFMLWRILLSIATTSHSASESFERPPSFFPPPTRRCSCDPGAAERPTSSPPALPSTGDGELSLRSWLAAVRSDSALLESFSMLLPLSCHSAENTSGALSSIISTAATMASTSPWCLRHHMAASGGRTRNGATRCTKRRWYRPVPHIFLILDSSNKTSPDGPSRVVMRRGERAPMISDAFSLGFPPEAPALLPESLARSRMAVPAETIPS